MSETSKSAPTILWDVIERLGKTALAGAALSYVAGYCVVCLHSAQYGVSSLDLVKPHYILAGLWLLLPLASMGVMTAFAVAVMFSVRLSTANATASSWKVKLKRSAWALGIWLSLLSVVFAIVARFLPRIRALPNPNQVVEYSRILRELAGSYLWITGFSLFGLMFWRGSRVATQKETKTLLRSAVAVVGVFLMFVSFEYVIWFSHALYPLIPQSIGGGRPILVRLISSSATVDGGRVPTVDKVRLSQPCLLLLEQADSLIVRFPSLNDQAFRLEKNAYAGYLIVPEGGNP